MVRTLILLLCFYHCRSFLIDVSRTVHSYSVKGYGFYNWKKVTSFHLRLEQGGRHFLAAIKF